MNDIKVEGFDMWEDKLFIMNPSTCGKLVELVWLDNDMAQMLDDSWTEGWYDVDPDYHPYEGKLDFGTGFRSDFSSSIKFTYAGQVADHASTIGNKRKESSGQYMIIPNVCPREVYFSALDRLVGWPADQMTARRKARSNASVRRLSNRALGQLKFGYPIPDFWTLTNILIMWQSLG